MNERLINGIYNNSINSVLKDIEETEKEILMASYKRYLVDSYADTLDEDDNIEQVIALYSVMEIKKWNKKSPDEKKSLLIQDENYKKLYELSNIGYKHANRKILLLQTHQEYIPSINEEQARKYIQEMEELYEGVKDYNKKMAGIYLSEGTMDFLYATQLTDNMSLRIGRML